MSKTSTGVVLRTPSGKYLRAYKQMTHTGDHTYIQETPDLDHATIFYPGWDGRKLRQTAERTFPDTTEVEVTVTRTINIVREGTQLCLP